MKASGSTRSMLHAVQTTYSEKTHVSLSNSTKTKQQIKSHLTYVWLLSGIPD